MGGYAGSVTAAEHRMLTQRPMSDMEEIRQLKLQIAAAKRAQQQQPAAAADTGAARNKAAGPLRTYQTKAQSHFDKWRTTNGQRRGESKDAYMARWQTDWNSSNEGKTANAELAPYLAEYDESVRRELRLAAEANPGDVKGAVDRKSTEIRGRVAGGSWEDQVLDGMVVDATVMIREESPELRQASLGVGSAKENRDAARLDLETLKTKRANAVAGVTDGPELQRISQTWDGQITRAEERLAAAEQALRDALGKEFAITLTEDVLAGAPNDPVARAQYDKALSGKVDIDLFTPAQVDKARNRVLANHPDLANDPAAFASVMLTAEAVKKGAEVNANLVKLDPKDPALPDWMKKLITEKNDPVTAAIIVTLALSQLPDPAPGTEKSLAAALQPYQPRSAAETALAEADPLTFGLLKYFGGTLDPKLQFGNFDIAKVNQARAQVEGLMNAALQSDPDKVVNLQIILMGGGYVRADWFEKELTATLASQSPEAGVDQIGRRKLLRDDDAGLSAGERAMLLIKQQMELCVTPEQLEDLWSRAEGPMRTYIDKQADYIKNRGGARSDNDMMVGVWLEAMSENAPPPAASLLLDAVMSRFDARVQFTPDTDAFSRGIQQAVDRAPQRAGDVARWIVTEFKSDNREGGIVPMSSVVKPRDDGDGLVLGKAIIERLKLDGVEGRIVGNMERVYGDAKGEAEAGAGREVQKDQFDLVSKNMPEVVQTMFDDLLGTTGDLFTKKHNLAGMNNTQQDNLIGRGLNLPPDNPNAGPNEPLYTDKAKLDQIRKAKEWIYEVSGGIDPTISFTPAIYRSDKDETVQTVILIRVESDQNGDGIITPDAIPGARGVPGKPDEDEIIDASMIPMTLKGQNLPWEYNDFRDYQEDNLLSDEGKLYMSNSGDLLLRRRADGHADVNLNGVNAAITTGWEKFRRGADIVIYGAAAIAGVALIFSTGGLAAPLVAGAGVAWGLFRTAETAGEMSSHGQSFNPIAFGAEGAWLGFIDPAAGGLWLGFIASGTGMAALKPVALLRGLSNLGKGATAEAALLKSAGIEAGSLSRNVGTDLFLKRGAQTAVYRAQFAPGQMGRAGMLNARTAQVSGTALMTTQAAGLISAAQAGQLDLTDFSLFSPTWDVALLGAGLAPVALGRAARFNYDAAATRTQKGDRPIPEDPTLLYALRGLPDENPIPARDVPASEAGDPGFTVRATPARTESLEVARQTQQDLFYTRTRLTLREKFGQWMRPNSEAASRSVVRLSDWDFDNTYMAISGKTSDEAAKYEGFYYPLTRTIYMRESAPGSFSPVNRHHLGHEMLHDASNDNFIAAAFSLVNPRTGVNMAEGATEYLTFRAFGPREFADREFGFYRFIEDATARGNPIPGYHTETKAAELIFSELGDNAYAAFFRGDEIGIEMFRQEALKLGFVERENGSNVEVMGARRNRRPRANPTTRSGVLQVPGTGQPRPGPVVRARQGFANARTELGFQTRYALRALKMFGIDPALRPVKFIGRKFHDSVPYIAILLPAADLAVHPWMSTRVREDIGAGNFFARGPALIVLAVATVKKKLSAVTRLGSTLRASAGSMFIMNAVGNSWKVAESAGDGFNASLAYQAFFATAQSILGARSLYSSYQGRKYARWSGLWDNPSGPAKTQLDNAQGLTWRQAAKTTGVPRKELQRASLGDAILIPDWGGKVMTRPKTLKARAGWATLAAKFGVPEAVLRQVNGNATGKRPKQNDILVPVVGRVPQGASWKTVNRLIRDLAHQHGVSSKSIKDFNGIGKSIRSQNIEVPNYIWERDSQTGRWMQVAGAANMAAASGTLGVFIDPGVWGLTDMGFVIADGAIAVGTAGTATMTAIPNKTKGTLAKRFPKTFAGFQITSATALGWKGLGHLLARGGVMGPDIQSKDIQQIES